MHLLENLRRRRHDTLAAHTANLEKNRQLHMRADEETMALRETITNAALSSMHHDILFSENILNSTRARGDILTSASTQLRRNTKIVKIRAKHALESREHIMEEIGQKKKHVETVVHLRSTLRADIDSALAQVLSLKDELSIYQNLEVYHSNHHRAHIAVGSEQPPPPGTRQDGKGIIYDECVALSWLADGSDFEGRSP